MIKEFADDTLLKKFKSGDEFAFNLIFNQYSKLLYSSAYNLFRNKQACEDMVQELFIELWEKKETLNIKSLKSYLFVCIRNKALMAIRSGKVTITTDVLIELCSKYETDHNLIAKELSEILNDSIDKLPKKCQAVFRLSRFENLSNKEIADKLNISIKTVENQMTIALSRLKNSSIDYLIITAVFSSLIKP